MKEELSRTAMLLGEDKVKRLEDCHVAVFGIGGVGGYVVEALARSGVGAIDIVDDDEVSVSNINRQIIALHSTVGRAKVDVMEERIHDINPDCKVKKYRTFYLPDNRTMFNFDKYDYIVDAIDTVTAKIDLVMVAQERGIPIISAMGAGNKLDASKFEITDIYKTSVCPLAKVMRKELKARGIKKLKVCYSKEEPVSIELSEELAKEAKKTGKRQIPGSNAYVPAVCGLMIAAEIIQSL